MPQLIVDRFTFDLPAGWRHLKYDDSVYYRKRFSDFAASKAVDLLALAPRHSALWMIEIKDYRRQRRTKPESLFTEVAHKVRDTLAGLAAARVAANDPQLQAFAADAMRADRFRVFLLFEQPQTPSKLFPQAVDPATAKTALKKAVRAVDPHPIFGNAGALTEKSGWNVTPP